MSSPEDVIVKLDGDPRFYSVPFESINPGSYRVTEAWDDMVEIAVIPAQPYIDAGYRLKTVTCDFSCYSLGGATAEERGKSEGHPFGGLKKDDVVVIPSTSCFVSFSHDHPVTGRSFSVTGTGVDKRYDELGIMEQDCRIRKLENFDPSSLNGDTAKEIYRDFRALGKDDFNGKYFPQSPA